MPHTPSKSFVSQSSDVFLSYARIDLDVANDLVGVLRSEGIEVALDTTHLVLGEEYQKRLDDLLIASAKVVFLATPHSVSSSACLYELELAARHTKPVLPVLVEGMTKEDLPAALRKAQYARIEEPSLAGKLAMAIRVDLEWERQHVEYQRLALRGTNEIITGRRAVEEAEDWAFVRPQHTMPVSAPVRELIKRSRNQLRRRNRFWCIGITLSTALVTALVVGTVYQIRIASVIDEIRLTQSTVLTNEEFELVKIGTPVDLLVEKLGQPKFQADDPYLVCTESARYLRWSDIGRNSIQVLADKGGKVAGFSLFSNHLPMRYAAVTVRPREIWNPHPDSRERLISHGDARFYGFVDDLGSAAPNNYHSVFVGWEASREHSAAIEALESFDFSSFADNENWEEQFGMTYGDFRLLQEELSNPKLGVFSLDYSNNCPTKHADRLRNLVFFTYSSFEKYEWWYHEHDN